MKIQITRAMVVINSRGEAERFAPTGPGEFRDDLDLATLQRLNRAGAAVNFSAGDQATNEGQTTAAETVTAAPNENGIHDPVAPKPVDLDGMTKDELVEYAKANSLDVDFSQKKADLLEAIKATAKAG